jgi:hypothetical protein
LTIEESAAGGLLLTNSGDSATIQATGGTGDGNDNLNLKGNGTGFVAVGANEAGSTGLRVYDGGETNYLQLKYGEITDSGTTINFGTEFIGIGGAAAANERLKLTLAATDTKGINADGTTNPFVYAGVGVTANAFTRTINTASAQDAAISQLNSYSVNWNGDITDSTGNFSSSLIDSLVGSLNLTGDMTTSGTGPGSATQTFNMNAGDFAAVSSNNTFTTNHAGSRVWNPRLTGGVFSASWRSPIISTQGDALYEAVGGDFSSDITAAATQTYTAGTQTIESNAGVFEATGINSVANLPSTANAIKLSASGCDTNNAIYVNAGTTELNDTNIGDGTNETQFSSDGTQTMVGTARVKRVLPLDLDAVRIGGVGPSNGLVGNFAVLNFKAATDDIIYFNFHVPEGLDPTENIVFTIFWSPSNANTDNVKWNLTYTALADGEDMSVAGTALTITEAANGTTDQLQISATLTIPAAAIAQEDIIGVAFQREGSAGTDTFTGLAQVAAIHIEYTVNKLGDPL